MKENADLFHDVFCPLLSLDDQLCSMFRLPSLSMILGGADAVVGGVASSSSSCPSSSNPYCSIISQHLQDASSSSPSSTSSPDPSLDPISCGPMNVFVSCFSSGSCSYVVVVVATVLGMYMLLAVVVNLVACYNFVVAWNLIARMYHVDLTFVSGPRPSSSSSSSRASSSTTQLSPASGSETRLSWSLRHLNRAWRGCTGFHTSRNDHTDTLVGAASMRDTCCPVCLEEFYEMEKVSSCEGGCGTWFHRACLSEWLDRSDSCPCCRRDMVNAPRHQSRGCWHDLTVFLGYAPAR